MIKKQTLPAPAVLAKRLWRVARVVYYMFRRSFEKRKLSFEIHLLFKRSKLKGKKAIWNLISHHQQHSANSKASPAVDDAEAEFVRKAFRRLSDGEWDEVESVVGVSRPRPVRQLRVTDSPFPLSQDEEEGGGSVDADAEEFITKFYEQLRQQQRMDEIEETSKTD